MSRARILADYVSSGDELADKAPLASPAFTGTPTGITAAHLEAGVLPAAVTGGSGLTALGTVTSGVLEDAVTYRSINQDLGTTDTPRFAGLKLTAVSNATVSTPQSTYGNAFSVSSLANGLYYMLVSTSSTGGGTFHYNRWFVIAKHPSSSTITMLANDYNVYVFAQMSQPYQVQFMHGMVWIGANADFYYWLYASHQQ